MDARSTCTRLGFTLLEIIITISIIMIIIGLVMPALQKSRAYSIRVQSENKLKQIGLALQNYASVQDDKVPGPISAVSADPTFVKNPMLAFTPYFGGELPMSWETDWFYDRNFELLRVRQIYISPADPTARNFSLVGPNRLPHIHASSYSYNMTAFEGQPTLSNGISDGTSSTIAFCERYGFINFTPIPTGTGRQYDVSEWYSAPREGAANHRASFADRGYFDVVPVTSGTPAITRSSIDNLTFEICPDQRDADYRIPQTPYQAGLLTAFFDGSVHMLRATIATTAFWSLVTRDKDDAVNDD